MQTKSNLALIGTIGSIESHFQMFGSSEWWISSFMILILDVFFLLLIGAWDEATRHWLENGWTTLTKVSHTITWYHLCLWSKDNTMFGGT